MEPALGKIKNVDTNETLPFCANPVEFKLTRKFDFNVEPLVKRSAPHVAYRGGGPTELTFHLMFDRDMSSKLDMTKIFKFVKGLNKIQDATQATPIIEFTLGTFVFRGHVSQLAYTPYRFDKKANPTGVRLELGLVSNGDYEDGD